MVEGVTEGVVEGVYSLVRPVYENIPICLRTWDQSPGQPACRNLSYSSCREDFIREDMTRRHSFLQCGSGKGCDHATEVQ